MIQSTFADAGEPGKPTEPDDRATRAGKRQFLFAETSLNSPLDELRAVLEKKQRTALNLGESERAHLFQEAYELARQRLEVALGGEPPVPVKA